MNEFENKIDAKVLEELELIKSFQDSGDVLVLNKLLERWSSIALGTAMQVMLNKSDAEDMVQESFIKIIKKLKYYKGEYGIRSWVMKIVLNTCINNKSEESKRKERERKVSTKLNKEKSSKKSEDKNIELFELIKSKWNNLPQHYRLPVWMRHYERMEFKEIANSLSLSENTVKSQAKRGLTKLKDILAKSGVTLTVVMLTNSLAYMEAEASTDIVVSNIPTIINSSKAVSATKSSSLIGFLKVAAFIGLTTTFLYLIYENGNLLNKNSSSTETDMKVEVPLFERWTEGFNKNTFPKEITILDGSASIKKDGGINNSGSLKTYNGSSRLNFKFQNMKLPIKLTYYKHIRGGKESGNGSVIYWNSLKWCCQLNGWGNRVATFNYKVAAKNRWTKYEVYMTNRATICYSNGKKSNLNIYNKEERSQFTFLFYGTHVLDNIKVEAINASQVPDITKELKAVDAIPLSKKIGAIQSKLKGKRRSKVLFKFLNSEALNGQKLELNNTNN